MYAVGRLGNYISRGVYTVSGSFHPFGGAVDIVVVQQQDGSLKSSPWYVRFGKFQGVLKAKEKVVDINVNGVEADFHMYLDQRGEAYFLREVDSEEAVDVVSSPSSSGEETEGEGCDDRPHKSKSLDCRFDQCDSVIDVSNGEVLSMNNSKRARILEFVLGRKSMKERSLSREEVDSDVGRMRSLERAEIAADLLEMNWSTSRSARTKIKDYREANSNYEEITGGKLETSLVLHEQHFVNSMVANDVYDSNKAIDEVHGNPMDNCVSKGESLLIGLNDANKPVTRLITAKEPTEVTTNQQENASIEYICEAEDDKCKREINENDELRPSLESNSEFQDVSVLTKKNPQRLVEEEFICSDLDDMNPSVNHIETVDQNYVSDSSQSLVDQERVKVDREGQKGNIRRRQAKSLPNMCSRLNDYEPSNLDVPQYYSIDSKSRYCKKGLVRLDASRIKEADLEKELQLSDSQSGNALSHDLIDDSTTGSNIVDGSDGSWSLWPFKRSTSKKFSQKDKNLQKDCDGDSGSEVNVEKEVSLPKAKVKKMYTKTLIPTSGQLASMKLTEGRNIVTFTFSTSVLGPQKVDARIYLWTWDTRIVISDVDGTITKSDVLGQFMPLVGKDWSHIGVTHLFSAIKENGYQLLFLSARAISQAHITRQFLFNLKQDGKALPDGPVVISPDGLFPSLFREVIRRAPHEFKIACLEDIKACFPSDKNPFYAGFGNRDTDEFSYLKVGIPKGKIFIINPKGEVVVNRSVDSKSYTSLHSLVHGIFPPISVHEEEEYNSWNFWKLPPPTVD